ncbi:P450-derived glycosyltransferase activator [Nonomuraea roseoviolacea]|uniref:P450-derived glycosyltransferase activator n=1 Tax=Nonomuraea roseoviolacea subsp. carminata TaxID=160689 RepID=A0ABT1JQS7_9ACTN|nr:P450-derived glycosyltransferase activator [Nonomuraea roseoviolacea]MCP2344069.1 P450-derived glycosyltransferase activator [Nonomuraea roseoviolacea subsp. carminata]
MPTTPQTLPPTAPTTTVTPSELGRHLLTIRGFHFVLGALGDPYARLLRGEGDDTAALGAEIRRAGPLFRSHLGTCVTASGEAAAALLRDPRLDTRHPGGDRAHLGENLWETWRTCHVTPMDDALLTLPLADYRRLDRVNRPVLGPVTAGAWRADVRSAAGRVADRAGETFDLAADLVRPAVAAALSRVLGLSGPGPDEGGRAAERELAELLPRLGVALDAVLCPPRLPVARDLEEAVARARVLVHDLVTARAAEPGDDAVSAMLATGLGEADVAAACLLHLVAGAEIAAATAADAVVALLDHPGQWAVVCRSPELAADAVEETLRWSPPVRLVSRTAQEPLAAYGQDIDADAHVVIVVDAANRDLAGVADPDRFDLAHAGAPSLSLTGGGPEELVAPLARVVATEIVRAAATRWPGLRADGAVVRRMRSPVVRAVVRLPLCR